jgi:carboxymethylenebutenolidase
MDKVIGQPSIPRRQFVQTLVAGFTLAAGPVSADAIITDTNGLDAGLVSIPVSDGKIPGYRARPMGKTNAPVILVVQEVFGVHEHIKDICRRFAKLGAYAIARSLYARYGDPGKYDMNSLPALMTDIVSKVPDHEVMSDLDSTATFATSEGANATRLGITGYCWGGRIVWLYAAHSAALKAGTSFYGPLRSPVPPNPIRPLYPLDLAKDLKAPVLGFYGALDRGIPVNDVETMRAALAVAGKRDCRLEVFMDAAHGFFADYRTSYNATDAASAWKQSKEWFHQHGVL